MPKKIKLNLEDLSVKSFTSTKDSLGGIAPRTITEEGPGNCTWEGSEARWCDGEGSGGYNTACA